MLYLQLFHAVEQGIFYEVAKYIVILSEKTIFIKNRPAASVLKNTFITVFVFVSTAMHASS